MTHIDLAIRLRAATQAVHERLHLQPSFASLQAGTLSSSEHASLMANMGGFYAAFDAHLAQAQEPVRDALGDYCYHPRGGLFREKATVAASLPEITTFAAFAGAIYVVDGAVLGGQVLGRANQHGTVHPYWAWCAKHGATVWRDARALIARADTEDATQAAVSTARAVFDAFERTVAPVPDRQYA